LRSRISRKAPLAMDIDPRWWEAASFEGQPVSSLLAERDISAVLRFLRTRGFSRARLAAMTGLSETRVRQIGQGRQRVTSYEVLERVADGLAIPRPYLGLGTQPGEIPTANDLADPDLHESWTDLLGVLSARSNVAGCADLRTPVRGQLQLIGAARAAARGPHRSRLMAIEAHWIEFLSWIEANGRRPARSDPLLDRAHSLAAEAGDEHLAAYILMRQSQQALDNGDAVRAAGLAARARETRRLPPRALALCHVREAEAYALADDAAASRESSGIAFDLLSRPLDAADRLGGHCTADYARASEARCRQRGLTPDLGHGFMRQRPA
jgi:transcriptional regulator with XRE-family HTH domain